MNRNESSGTQVENGFDCAGVSVGVGDGEGAGERECDCEWGEFGVGMGERGRVGDKGDGVVHPPLGLSGIELFHQLIPHTR